MCERKFVKGLEDDLVLLEELSAPSIVRCLKNRFEADKIYTYIGEVLLSVNPFRMLPIYNQAIMSKYTNRFAHELEPHVYSIAETSYTAMCRGKHQCILITGESGAGKTEASKKIMEFVAYVSLQGSAKESRAVKLKEQLLQSNPLLEAFGNAKTIMNNNSSRFGKYMEIEFDPSGRPLAGRVTNFLLEKIRVVKQAKSERNFHIFYQVLRGWKTTDCELLQPKEYAYLNQSGCDKVRGINDTDEFEETMDAMECSLGYDERQRDSICGTVAAILWLGNISFESISGKGGAEGAKISNEKACEQAAKMLGVSPKGLATALTERTFAAGAEKSVQSSMTAAQAAQTRDALAKALYTRLFDGLVKRLNVTLRRPDDGYNTEGYASVGPAAAASAASVGPRKGGKKRKKKKKKAKGGPSSGLKHIGILDIYGFEIFETNSFEQFCINYVNEKLQQLFIELTLKKEQELYVKEGIKWTPVKYFNNKVVCHLIESKKATSIGILAMLDDASAQQHSTNKNLLTAMNRAFTDHPHYATLGAKGSNGKKFLIKHYAGDVPYSIVNFIEKNRDQLYPSLKKLMGSSSVPFLSELFPTAKGRIRKKPPTAATQFKHQVSGLMDALNQCEPHYIRCIKSNDAKAARRYNDPRVEHQVKYLGLLENVRVRRAGFAFRLTYRDFYRRYKIICPMTWPSWKGDEGDIGATKAVLLHVGVGTASYLNGGVVAWGKTMLFLKKPQTLFMLESARERRLPDMAAIIQKTYQRYLAYKFLKEMRRKAQGIYQGRKRRCRSINLLYAGDYAGLSNRDPVLDKLRANGDTKIIFSDEITKFNYKLKAQQRILMLTDKALYNIKPPIKRKCKVQRRLALTDIAGVTLSTFADGFVNVNVAAGSSEYKRGNFLYLMKRKTEFVAMISEQLSGMGKTLALAFEDVIKTTIHGTALQIRFEENIAVPAREEMYAHTSKTVLNVQCGPSLASKAPVQIT